jgi:type IV secretion system protein VirD4
LKKRYAAAAFGIIPAAALGFLIAPFAGSGLSGIMAGLAGILSGCITPYWCCAAPACMAACAAVYSAVAALLLSDMPETRRGEERGSASWGDPASLGRKYSGGAEAKILTKHVSIGLDTKRHQRNLNTLVIGGSGAGKTRCFCIPNLLSAREESVFVLDPKGEIVRETGSVLESRGYKVKVLDLISMDKSACYNPFRYVSDENDVQRLVTNLMRSTLPRGSRTSDPFWDTSAAMLLSALIYLLKSEAPPEEQNFGNVMELLRRGAIEDEERPSDTDLDRLFYDLGRKDPENIALKYYKSYHSGSPKTLKSIQVTLMARLEKFNLESVRKLTSSDDLDLGSMGLEKTALFAVIPDNDSSFNFLVSMLYTQLFQQLFRIADRQFSGSLPVPVHLIMDEFSNVTLPSSFDRILSVMRSRGVFVSIILQNMSQLRALYEKNWESIVGNCDELLYMGGGETSTHELMSKMLGDETIEVRSYSKSKGQKGSYGENDSSAGRKLMFPDEVRRLDGKRALLFIRGEKPVIDEKYDMKSHPQYGMTYSGGGPAYRYWDDLVPDAVIESISVGDDENPDTAVIPEMEAECDLDPPEGPAEPVYIRIESRGRMR